ncbi:MAG TPA: hypothetical protein VKP03_00060 [Patescibacteria group bacterium]|nr:hypothetical protein [Patescibacteria group bacterium]
MLNQVAKSEKRNSLIILFLIIIVIVGVLAAHKFYFSGEPKLLSKAVFSAKSDFSVKDYAEESEDLMQSDKLKKFKKFGDWPVETDMFLKSGENPFKKIQQK